METENWLRELATRAATSLHVSPSHISERQPVIDQLLEYLEARGIDPSPYTGDSMSVRVVRPRLIQVGERFLAVRTVRRSRHPMLAMVDQAQITFSPVGSPDREVPPWRELTGSELGAPRGGITYTFTSALSLQRNLAEFAEFTVASRPSMSVSGSERSLGAWLSEQENLGQQVAPSEARTLGGAAGGSNAEVPESLPGRLQTMRGRVVRAYDLERHIEEALDAQLDTVKDHPKAYAAVRRFHGTVRTQRDAMKAHLDEFNGGPGTTLASAVSALFGAAAGVVDKVRPEAVSKCLEDDYTAFNLAAMGYHMLYGTALMLGFQQTATIAERHHRAYTDMVQDINQIILDVVAWELRNDGLAISERAMDQATEIPPQASRPAVARGESLSD